MSSSVFDSFTSAYSVRLCQSTCSALKSNLTRGFTNLRPRLPCRTRRRARNLVVSAKGEDLDFVERWYGKIFGKKALDDRNPMGMKRLGVEEAPEMFPATIDRWAEAVEGDDTVAASMRVLMAGTRLERVPMRVAYCADQHGWTAKAFHSRLNTLGAGLVVATTQGGAICGGYNPAGWIGLGDDRDSLAAFLFTWPDGDTSGQPIKLRKVGGSSLAVVDKAGKGPQFGADGLKILLQEGKERSAQSRLGSYYEKIPGGGRSLFAAGEDWKAATLRDLKVVVAVGDPEQWNLDGIVWKTQ